MHLLARSAWSVPAISAVLLGEVSGCGRSGGYRGLSPSSTLPRTLTLLLLWLLSSDSSAYYCTRTDERRTRNCGGGGGRVGWLLVVRACVCMRAPRPLIQASSAPNRFQRPQAIQVRNLTLGDSYASSADWRFSLHLSRAVLPSQ